MMRSCKKSSISVLVFLSFFLSPLSFTCVEGSDYPSKPEILEKSSSGDLLFVSGGIIRPENLPRMENLTYTIAEGDIMGTHLRVPTINADFDEPIFGLFADHWCVGCQKKKQKKGHECSPCDYSKKDRGGCSKEARKAEKENQGHNGDVKHPCVCQPSLFCEIDSSLNAFDENYKLDQRDWVELEFGRKILASFQPPEAIVFRFYAPDPCKYIRIVVEAQQGYPGIVEVANEKMWKNGMQHQNRRNNYVSNPFLELSMSGDVPPSSDFFICPNDEYELFEPGTYFVRVSVADVPAPWSYNLLVEAIGESTSITFYSFHSYPKPHEQQPATSQNL
jgi:hypothetical protein